MKAPVWRCVRERVLPKHLRPAFGDSRRLQHSAGAPVATYGGTAEDQRQLRKQATRACGVPLQLDVTPVKRPFLEGTLSFPVENSIEVIFVSGILGTSSDEVAHEVYSEAIRFAAAVAKTFPRVSLPAVFRQQLLMHNSELLSDLRSLDLTVRLHFHTERGKHDEVKCLVHIWDTWQPYPQDECIAEIRDSQHDFSTILERVCYSVTRHIEQGRRCLCTAAAAEIDLCMSDIGEKESMEALCWMGAAGASSCDCKCLIHNASGEALALVCTLCVGESTPSRCCIPLVAIQVGNTVYGNHHRPPCMIEQVKSWMEDREVVQECPGARWPPHAVTRAIESLRTHSPEMAHLWRSMLPETSRMPGTVLQEYIAFSGCSEINQWLLDKEAASAVHCRLQGHVAAGVPTAAPAITHTVDILRVLEGMATVELGWRSALVAPLRPCGLEPPLEMRFLLALKANDASIIYGSTDFRSAREALTTAAPWVMEASFFCWARTGTTPYTREDAALHPTQKEEAERGAGNLHERGRPFTVEVPQIAATLRQLGIVQYDFEPSHQALACLHTDGSLLYRFTSLNTVTGFCRLLRFCASKNVSRYAAVTVDGSTTPQEFLQRCLGSMMSPTAEETPQPQRPPPYSNKFSLPLPGKHKASFSLRNQVEYQGLVNQLLGAIQEHSKRPALTPFPAQPSPCFFDLWPVTRHVLTLLRSQNSSFSYAFSATHPRKPSEWRLTMSFPPGPPLALQPDTLLEDVYDCLQSRRQDENAMPLVDSALLHLIPQKLLLSSSPRRAYRSALEHLLRSHEIYEERGDVYHLAVAITPDYSCSLLSLDKSACDASQRVHWRECVAREYFKQKWAQLYPFVLAFERVLRLLEGIRDPQDPCQCFFTQSMDGECRAEVRNATTVVCSASAPSRAECLAALLPRLQHRLNLLEGMRAGRGNGLRPKCAQQGSSMKHIQPPLVATSLLSEYQLKAQHAAAVPLLFHEYADQTLTIFAKRSSNAPPTVLASRECGGWNEVPRHLHGMYRDLGQAPLHRTAAEITKAYSTVPLSSVGADVDAIYPVLCPVMDRVAVSQLPHGMGWEASLKIPPHALLFPPAHGPFVVSARQLTKRGCLRVLLTTLAVWARAEPS